MAVDDYLKAPMQDSFGRRGAVITPDDDNDLASIAKAVVVLEVGTLAIVPADNDPADVIEFAAVPVGYVPPFMVRRVMATNTTATVASVDG